MRILMIIAAFLAVLGMAYWAYQQNFQTKQAQDRVRALQIEIAETREAIAIQRAEWAYLNRPERLRDLVDLNFEDLQLLPMAPYQFGRIDEVPYPQPEEPAQDIAPAPSNIAGELTDAQATVAFPRIDGEDYP